MRAVRAAQLLDRGFAGNGLSWLRPSLGTVDQLAPIDTSPPNLRDEMCGGKHHRPASDADEEAIAGNAGSSGSGENGATFFAAGLQPPLVKPSDLMAAAPAPSEPIVVYTGPTKTGAALIAAVAAESEKQAERPKGRKARAAGKKSNAATAEAKTDAKPDAPPAKPAGTKHANAKPDAADKPAAAADQAPAKPAKPKTAAKPAAKPAPKSSSDAKPAG
jgi:D-alanyl-D-alanine carboxypeptidase